jgi:hypothetical protein
MHTYNYNSEFYIVRTEYHKSDFKPMVDSFSTLESAKEFRDERLKNPNVRKILIMELISTSE